ncbi:metallophosphoesterase, partial [Candidatus Uhrbacteria bacterium]|nr:metallophosphoesterase [Candidatus Uhrbacteria bacterium]
MTRIACAAFLWSVSICGFADEPAALVPVRFGLLTDLHAHDLDSPAEGKWMRNTALRLSAFTSAMNEEGVDFVIQLGDFVNGWAVFGVEPGDPGRIPEILSWADGLMADFAGPRYHVVGNHDVYNLDKAQLRTLLSMERTSYSFDVGAFHFVALDLQYADDGRDLSHTYTGVGGTLPAPV